jgi:hypothetical protein
MRRLICAALFVSFAHLGCSSEAPTEPTGNENAELSLVPFCLPGEKRVCTLGPPPVCHCELENPPVVVAAPR